MVNFSGASHVVEGMLCSSANGSLLGSVLRMYSMPLPQISKTTHKHNDEGHTHFVTVSATFTP